MAPIFYMPKLIGFETPGMPKHVNSLGFNEADSSMRPCLRWPLDLQIGCRAGAGSSFIVARAIVIFVYRQPSEDMFIHMLGSWQLFVLHGLVQVADVLLGNRGVVPGLPSFCMTSLQNDAISLQSCRTQTASAARQ